MDLSEPTAIRVSYLRMDDRIIRGVIWGGKSREATSRWRNSFSRNPIATCTASGFMVCGASLRGLDSGRFRSGIGLVHRMGNEYYNTNRSPSP
jgi:hypothetical protein